MEIFVFENMLWGLNRVNSIQADYFNNIWSENEFYCYYHNEIAIWWMRRDPIRIYELKVSLPKRMRELFAFTLTDEVFITNKYLFISVLLPFSWNYKVTWRSGFRLISCNFIGDKRGTQYVEPYGGKHFSKFAKFMRISIGYFHFIALY